MQAVPSSCSWSQDRAKGFARDGPPPSDPLGLARPLASGASRVERGLGFQKQDVNLLVRDRAVLGATRNDHELTRVDEDLPLAEAHAQSPPQDQEQLVLRPMGMPDQIHLDIDKLHL